MIAVLLGDKTVIYAKSFKVGASAIFVENFKFKRGEETAAYVEDAMTIHFDAIQSYAISHDGGKKKEEINDDEVSENRHDPSSSA